METLTALFLTITVLNLVRKAPSFYYTIIFAGPSISYRALQHKQFGVTFTESSSRPEVFIKISQN